jgi:hypothetical protein
MPVNALPPALSACPPASQSRQPATPEKKPTAYLPLSWNYGDGGTRKPVGGTCGQSPASYFVQAAGAVGTKAHTFSPNRFNEFEWGCKPIFPLLRLFRYTYPDFAKPETFGGCRE